MATSIKDLLKDLDADELLQDMLDAAKALGLSVKGWQSGSPILALLDIFSSVLTLLWNTFVGPALRAQFLDYASDVWLTLVAALVYGVYRSGAVFATGTCKVENRGGNFYSFSPGDIRIKDTSTGKTYVSTSGGSLSPWSGSGNYPTLSLTFQADEIGSASKAAIGEIEAYPNTLPLGPADVYAGDGTHLLGGGASATNAEEFLGEDEEGDEDLKTRCRLSTGPLSPGGPKDAYAYIALSVRKDPSGNNIPLLPWSPGYDKGISVNVNRVRALDIGGGVLRVWVASSTGAAAGTTGTVGSDVWYVNAAIQEWIPPGGITAVVSSADQHTATFTATVYVDARSNVTAAEAKTAVEDALSVWFAALPISGARLSPGGPGYVFSQMVGAEAERGVQAIRAGACIKVIVTGNDTPLSDNEVAVPALTVVVNVVNQ